MKAALFALCFLLAAFPASARKPGTCTGLDPCPVCSDCSRCKYCSPKNPQGGSCGTIRAQTAAEAARRLAKQTRRS